VARVQNLPHADNSFDTVTAFEVLEHIDDVSAALGELRRVAKHNVILTVPNCTITPGMKASGLIYHHWYDPTHVNFWSTEQFAEVVAGAGFHVEAVNNINAINLGYLVMESLGLKGWLAKAGQRLFKAVQRPYEMTTLVVARIN
jgi:ubiquinone/menaquinone biosynthesis C-methylase UbiE